MAAPSYTTDLTTFNDASDVTGWGEFTNMALGAGPDIDTDLAIYGSICITQDRAKVGLNSQGYSGTAITLPTNGAFFIWTKFFAPNSLDTLASGGQRVVIGTDLANWKAWYVDGSDTYQYGGWKNYAVDPTVTADVTNGTVTTYNASGNGWLLIAAPAKGNPFNTDIIRYGRGESRFTDGDITNGYATFSGYALVNDNPTTGRFGLIQAEGTGYLFKGLMSLGLTATSVDMRDSNVNITIDNTTKVSSVFNRIEVHNASSNVEWNRVNVSSLSSISKGEFEMIDNATVAFTDCVFTDMSTFIFQSNATLTRNVFSRCGLTTQGGSSISSCSFSGITATSSILASDISLLDNSSFVSDGSNHAIELDSAHAGSSYDVVGMSFTGYAGSDGSTGNECIYNNSGGAVTLNILSGDTPTIRNGAGASTTIVAGSVTTAVNVKALDTGLDITSARVLIEVTDGTNFPYQDSITITGTGTTATVTHTAHGLVTGDKIIIRGAIEDEYNGVYAITVTGVDNYTYTTSETIGTTPATGTITATFAIIHALTDALGDVSDTRVFSANQPFSGRVRKSSASPYYKSFPFTGTVDSSSGFSLNVSLVKDE